ncbi:hypothetical protein B0E41_02835 [Hydrogenophaga sp. A37]|nr:hypothetical protein B0E41_02835 [Hydrogenophaga sp. A37]
MALWGEGSPGYLVEVFDRIGVDINELQARHHGTLRRLSDTNLQVWPGQWISGLCSAAVRVLGSELSAAFVLSQPGLAAPGALHYFHPQQDDLNRLSCEWLGHFGLRAHGQPDNVKEAPIDIFGNERLSTGFRKLIADIQDLSASISRNRGNEEALLSDFKALTVRSAALLVFTTASRGSRLDKLKCGSLLAHEELIHVEDKEVADGRGSRLLPKLDIHYWLLNGFLKAQTAASEKLVRQLPTKMRGDVLLELANQDLRFDAGCFQYFGRKGQRISRTPVSSADIGEVAQQYLQAPRNFMRHVVITHWTLARMDCTVLRALTGHAWASAEAPGPCATYAPTSLIAAIKAPLEQLLATWIVSPTQSQGHRAWPTHRLPLWRLFKVQGHYRKFITDGLQGPVFSRWHVAAMVMAEHIRHNLCSGQLPLGGKALMWLYLVFVDGLNEPQDLKAIFDHGDVLTRGTYGWTARWRREADRRNGRLIALQAPTSLFLESHWSSISIDAKESIGTDLARWLTAIQPNHPSKDCTPDRAKAILLAVASLWSDVAIPSALQTAYSTDTNAPFPSLRSAERLVNGFNRHTLPITTSGSRPSLVHQSESALHRLLKLIHKVGDNQQRLGEQKARAAYFLGHAASLRGSNDGSWTNALIKAIQQNIELIQHGSRKALQFSSLSTYVSSITDFIISRQNLNLLEVEENDLQVLSIELLEHARRKDGPTKSDVQSAAFWLLRSLENQGFRVLLHPPASSFWRLRPGRSRPVPVIDATDSDAAQTMLSATHTATQLNHDQLHLLVDLLQQVPLRWMEAATLDTTHILLGRPALRVEPSGFSHTKSTSSTRTLELPAALHGRLLDLARRVSAVSSSNRPLLFSEASSGSDDEAVPSRHNEDLAWVMRCILEDDFRIHDLRANVVSSLIFPGWRKTFDRWVRHQASGDELRGQFEHSSQSAWSAERASVVAGHSHPVVGVSYYAFIWPFLRCLALASLNAHLVPGSEFLRHASLSSAALDKARQRSSDTASNPWNHLASKRFHRDKLKGSNTPQPPTLHTPTVSMAIADQASAVAPVEELKQHRSLCLCSSGLPLEDSMDMARIEPHHRDALNTYLASLSSQDLESLRKREGGSSGQRSAAAEIDLIRSQAFEDLFKVLAPAAPHQLRRLLVLLSSRSGRDALPESSLSEVAGIFDGGDFKLEVIFGQRHFDAGAAARLSACKSLVMGQPVRDQGRAQRAFILQRSSELSLVAKARWRSVAAQLTFHLVRYKFGQSET